MRKDRHWGDGERDSGQGMLWIPLSKTSVSLTYASEHLNSTCSWKEPFVQEAEEGELCSDWGPDYLKLGHTDSPPGEAPLLTGVFGNMWAGDCYCHVRMGVWGQQCRHLVGRVKAVTESSSKTPPQHANTPSWAIWARFLIGLSFLQSLVSQIVCINATSLSMLSVNYWMDNSLDLFILF